MILRLTIFLLALCLLTQVECYKRKKLLDWWQSDVIYQIYPRSFKDSNADGVGDLNGVYQKLDYLKTLGVGAIWLSPIFASPMVDFGYDISNFKEIEPMFGTMDDFDKLTRKAKKLGLKVLLDFVPNHTSDKHEWFLKSVKRISPYTDYYVWKDAKRVNGKRRPPNNWLSVFGKSAWQWNKQRKQYYLHQFAVAQPDLDYRNPVVYEEMKNVLIFWLDKGVDGFRVDSFNHIYENASFPDEPLSHQPFYQKKDYYYLSHIYSRDQPESFEIAKDWRKVLDKYTKRDNSSRVLLGEAYADLDVVMKFYGDKRRPGIHFPFNFMMINKINTESNASFVVDRIKEWYDAMPDGTWANWVIGNHDNSRPASRFGYFLIDGLHMLQMLLPGTAIVYNGDELAMEDTYIRWDQTVDPPALNAGRLRYQQFSRDPARSPFQWDDSENAGFTRSLTTWLPINPGYWKVNVAAEQKEAANGTITHLQNFIDLVQLRKNIVFQKGDLHLYVLSQWVFAIVRSYPDHATYAIVINLGSEITISDLQKLRPSLPESLSVVLPSVNSNYKKGDSVDSNAMKLRPKAAIVVTTSLEDWENDLKPDKINVKHFK